MTSNSPGAATTAPHAALSEPRTPLQLMGEFTGRVVAALAPGSVPAATVELTAAGFPPTQIAVFTGQQIGELSEALNHPGILDAIDRLTLGDGLFDLKRFIHDLSQGDDVVGVAVRNDEEAQRVAVMLRRHGGYGITHFGRWLVTRLN